MWSNAPNSVTGRAVETVINTTPKQAPAIPIQMDACRPIRCTTRAPMAPVKSAPAAMAVPCNPNASY